MTKIKQLGFIVPILFFLIGTIFYFYPILQDTSKMPGDIYDTRFITYVLEHGFLFFTNNELHSSFWDMPIFYPNKNTLAYSDVLLGEMLVYAPLRLFLEQSTAIQVLAFIFCGLNFFSFFLVSKKLFKFGGLISSICAFLFAFSLIRYSHLIHLQFLTQCFSIFSLYFFFKADKRWYFFLISSLFLVIQFYSSFYLGWFVVFGGVVALLVMVCFKNTRLLLIDFIKENKTGLLVFCASFSCLMLPLMVHYLKVSQGFACTKSFLFRPNSFLFSLSALDTNILKFLTGTVPHLKNHEAESGLGILATIFAIIGCFKFKKYRPQILIFYSVIVAIFMVYFLYKFVFMYFLGASAIRAAARAVFLLMPIFIFFVGTFFKNIKNKAIFAICLIILLIEQVPLPERIATDKTAISKRLELYPDIAPLNCKVFYVESFANNIFEQTLVDIDAMFLTLKYNIPTANGYSGYIPPIEKNLVPKSCIIKAND